MDSQIIGSSITAVATIIAALITGSLALIGVLISTGAGSKLLNWLKRLTRHDTNRSNTGEHEDELEERLKGIEQELAVYRDDPVQWKSKGWALYELGRYEEARAAFGLASEVKPDYPWGLVRRGLGVEATRRA